MRHNRPFLLTGLTAETFWRPGSALAHAHAEQQQRQGGGDGNKKACSVGEALVAAGFGDEVVPVTRCTASSAGSAYDAYDGGASDGGGGGSGGSGRRGEIVTTVRDFVARHQAPSSAEGVEESLYYLKDWHFARCGMRLSDDGSAMPYVVPEAFRDDWLNWWADHSLARIASSSTSSTSSTSSSSSSSSLPSREEGSGDSEAGTGEEKTRGGAAIGDDYRFLYMGAAPGTWTAMHHDVLLSYSWSLNVQGRKRWIFFPPGKEPVACRARLDDDDDDDDDDDRELENNQSDGASKELFPDVRPLLLPASARAEPPSSEETEERRRLVESLRVHCARHAIVVEQEPFEAIFVPSGWHHQVENLPSFSFSSSSSATANVRTKAGAGAGAVGGGGEGACTVVASVNHNWFNGFSVGRVVTFLLAELDAVRGVLGPLDDGTFIGSSSSSSEEGEEGGEGAEGEERGRRRQRDARSNAWERHCEKVLRANAGMNLSEMVALLWARARHYRRHYWSDRSRNPSDSSTSTSASASTSTSTSTSTSSQDASVVPPSLRELSSYPEPCFTGGGGSSDGSAAVVLAWAGECIGELWANDGEDGSSSSGSSGGSVGMASSLALRVALNSLLEIVRALCRIAAHPAASRHVFPWALGRRRRRRRRQRKGATSSSGPSSDDAADAKEEEAAAGGATMGMEALGSAVRTALSVILELVENGREGGSRDKI